MHTQDRKPAPTYRRVRLVKRVNHLLRRELKIDPRFAVVKEVLGDELLHDFRQAFTRIMKEQKEDGIGADVTITRSLPLAINGDCGTYDLYGFPKTQNVYIVDSHDPCVIYKAD